jgi:hypothetical protein
MTDIAPRPAAIGDNSRARFETLARGLETTFAAIDARPLSAEKAIKAKDLGKAALDTAAELERERKELQQPYQDTIDAIRAEFKPWVAKAEEIKESCRKITTAWLIEERRQNELRAEQERLALEAAKAEADRLAKLAQEDAFASLDAADAQIEVERQEIAAHYAENVAAARPSISGVTSTRASSLRTTWSARLTDGPSAVMHFANHPDMQALALKLAAQAMKASKGSAAIPGVEPVKMETAI